MYKHTTEKESEHLSRITRGLSNLQSDLSRMEKADDFDIFDVWEIGEVASLIKEAATIIAQFDEPDRQRRPGPV